MKATNWLTIPTRLSNPSMSFNPVLKSTPMVISAPIFFATSTGKLLDIPPSTNNMLSNVTGAKAPGIAMLARIAKGNTPLSITTSAPSTMFAATQAKGIGKSLKEMES